jgi:flagellar biogenesis protein FliO
MLTGIFMKESHRVLTICLVFMLLLVCATYAAAQEVPGHAAMKENATEMQSQPSGGNAPGEPSDHVSWRIIGAIFFILVIFGGYLWYMFILQRRFFEGCRDDNQMQTFFNTPAGLPVGTVRSIIALIIITVSLSLIVLSMFRVGVDAFPEVLVGILGTVLGFYFGSRTASKGDEAAKEQIQDLKTQRDEVIDQQNSGQTDTLLSKIRKGIAMSKAAVEFLPEEERKKYGNFIGKLEQGMDAVQSIARAGNVKEAASKASEIYGLFQSDNPALGSFAKAVQAFGQVAGIAVPAASIASTVVVLGTKLAGTIYQKWKARVLHAPFSPAVIPLKVVDANTGFTLMLNSPIFRKAFSKELEANDRQFMESIVRLLGQGSEEEFWTKYKDRFESRDQFDSGLEEFRRIAADLELQNDIPSLLLSEAGGYKAFMDSIDKINADPEAKAALDQLFIVAESLHKNGEPVLSILDKVKSGVKS